MFDSPRKDISGTEIGAEICEGDEHRKFQFLESGDALNGQNLFSELPFPVEFLTNAFIH